MCASNLDRRGRKSREVRGVRQIRQREDTTRIAVGLSSPAAHYCCLVDVVGALSARWRSEQRGRGRGAVRISMWMMVMIVVVESYPWEAEGFAEATKKNKQFQCSICFHCFFGLYCIYVDQIPLNCFHGKSHV